MGLATPRVQRCALRTQQVAIRLNARICRDRHVYCRKRSALVTSRFALATVAVVISAALAQTGDRRDATGRDPCPGGRTTTELETIAYLSVDQLIRASELIVVGTITKVLPAFVRDPNHPAG